ncbi:hypothetical protein CSOJ01_09831 [Colletotrichum sojae]|uniref:Uncharacterized protein n=1 Tax=Colletotrichum sojae TaxID=2175907 RepID=A0A8H6J249_9PEZI|nr:hypothetical protein CSOJ01_09831 [Colletotrichum sojae]
MTRKSSKGRHIRTRENDERVLGQPSAVKSDENPNCEGTYRYLPQLPHAAEPFTDDRGRGCRAIKLARLLISCNIQGQPPLVQMQETPKLINDNGRYSTSQATPTSSSGPDTLTDAATRPEPRALSHQKLTHDETTDDLGAMETRADPRLDASRAYTCCRARVRAGELMSVPPRSRRCGVN